MDHLASAARLRIGSQAIEDDLWLSTFSYLGFAAHGG
jgi:hypothetical protein